MRTWAYILVLFVSTISYAQENFQSSDSANIVDSAKHVPFVKRPIKMVSKTIRSGYDTINKKISNYLGKAKSAIEHKSFDVLQELYSLSEASYKRKDYKLAYEYYKKYAALQDSILKIKAKEQIADLESKYQFEKKKKEVLQLRDSIFRIKSNKEIASLESKYQFEKKQKELMFLVQKTQQQSTVIKKSETQIRNQTSFIVLISVSLILALILSYIIFRLYKSKEGINNKLANQNTEIFQQKKKIEESLLYTQQLQELLKNDLNHYMQVALRKQMNPHFIFNSLNSIQNYILVNDKLSANLYLAKFSELMRKVLENSGKGSVSIKEELETVKLYIELERKRFDNKFEFKLDIDPGVTPSVYLIPPLILQPYVENAIWHGLLHKDDNCHLLIKVKKEDDQIIFTIKDNGIGREAALIIKQKGNFKQESLGTKITAKRIALVNSLNSSNIHVHYTDLKNTEGYASGTMVEITIPAMDTFT